MPADDKDRAPEGPWAAVGHSRAGIGLSPALVPAGTS